MPVRAFPRWYHCAQLRDRPPLKSTVFGFDRRQYKTPKTIMKLQNAIFRFLPKSYFDRIGLAKKDVIGLADSMLDLDFSRDLSSISCPALIICGGKDSANMKAAKTLSDNIPYAKLRIIEGAGHMVNESNPEALAALLKSYYSNELK